jgi:hypothetical protein
MRMDFQLQPELFTEVLSQMPSLLTKKELVEKRKAVRVPLEGKVSLWRVENGVSCGHRTVLSRDLSCTGIGVLGSQAMESGQQAVARLSRQGSKSLWILCRVVFSRQLADDIYGIGMELMNIVDGESRLNPEHDIARRDL